MTVTWPPPLIPGGIAAEEPSPDPIRLKWSAVHDAAGVVAALAGVSRDLLSADATDLPAMMNSVGGWRLALAAHGVDDLAAVLEPGIAALLSIHSRGGDPTVAAQALWEEFVAARDALLALLPPPRL
jgi:hypothetical protein